MTQDKTTTQDKAGTTAELRGNEKETFGEGIRSVRNSGAEVTDPMKNPEGKQSNSSKQGENAKQGEGSKQGENGSQRGTEKDGPGGTIDPRDVKARRDSLDQIKNGEKTFKEGREEISSRGPKGSGGGGASAAAQAQAQTGSGSGSGDGGFGNNITGSFNNITGSSNSVGNGNTVGNDNFMPGNNNQGFNGGTGGGTGGLGGGSGGSGIGGGSNLIENKPSDPNPGQGVREVEEPRQTTPPPDPFASTNTNTARA